MLNTDKRKNVAVLSYPGEISSCLCCKIIFLCSILFKYVPGPQRLTKKNTSLWKRIRITEHLLQIHLLFAIWACLFLTHNAPSSNTKFMKSGNSIKKTMHGNYSLLHSNTSNRIKWLPFTLVARLLAKGQYPEGPATSRLGIDFLGFPVSVSDCWDGSQDSKLLLHASHAALLS